MRGKSLQKSNQTDALKREGEIKIGLFRFSSATVYTCVCVSVRASMQHACMRLCVGIFVVVSALRIL